MNAEFRIDGKTLETPRLFLRPFKASDLDDFFEYASVAGVGEMAGWVHHADKEESLRILGHFISEDRTFAVVFRETGKVIGSLGIEKYGREEALTEFDGYRGREIGYVLAKPYWGRGLMAEALKAVIDWLFTDYDLDFLTSGHFDFNRQSARVQEKSGFRPYRKLVMDTKMGTQEPGVLTLLLNPQKSIHLVFSHPETLIWTEE